MPVFKCNGALHYYAHVPKCGGRSVEEYLKERFGELWFLDDAFYSPPPAERWTKSAPQHVPFAALTRLIPETEFASSFAVVRHPVDRAVSSFNYFKSNMGRVPLPMSMEEWFEEYVALRHAYPFYLDNHLRPQHELIPDAARIFRLESELDDLVSHLDDIAGEASGPRAIPKTHATGKRADLVSVPVPPGLIARLQDYYAVDFERFGYAPDPTKPPMMLMFDKSAHGPVDQLRHFWRLQKRRLWLGQKRRFSNPGAD